MHKVLPPLSIVVPALNEADNLPLLVQRVAEPLVKAGITYEVLIVDDRSTDNTAAVVARLAKTYPVRLVTKTGKRGKAYSLLQGFDLVKYDLICMIDADLQYPPEAIVPMYRKLLAHDADVVVTNRIDQKTSFVRQLSTKVFHFLMARVLFGIDYDTQSGLKLFKKSVLKGMDLKPSAWSFDLEFLIRSLEKRCAILSYAIPFGERHSGEAKVRLLNVTYQLTSASLKLRFNSSIRKIRSGYRASMELARRPAAMGILFAAGVLGSLTIATAAQPAQAHAASIMDPVKHWFTSDNRPTAKPTSDNQVSPQSKPQPQAQPQPAASSTGTSSTPASTGATTPAQQNQVATTASPNSTSSAQPTTSTSTAATSTPTNKPATTPASSTKRASSGNDYYASSALSSSRTNQLLNLARWAAGLGAAIVVAVLAAWGVRSLFRTNKRKASRDLYRV